MCLDYLWMSPEERRNSEINKQINQEIEREKRTSQRIVKLLLLGAAESGKSTFVKQMRIIHGDGYSEEDRRAFTMYIHHNIVGSMQAILAAMPSLGVSLTRGAKLVEEIEAIKSYEPKVLTKRELHVIQCLWLDKGVQEAFRRCNEYQLSDCTAYFMDRLGVIWQPDYIPSEQDVLRVRIPTTKIVTHDFEVQNIHFEVIDVSGQRSERKKWLHHFDNVTSVIFLASLSEYDQTLMENPLINRLDESLALYQGLLKFTYFVHSTSIIFLNKTDLLAEKVLHSHLVDYFPNFEGKKKDAKAAMSYIHDLFSSINQNAGRTAYFHFTCATQTRNIEVVFKAVKDTILGKVLEGFDLA